MSVTDTYVKSISFSENYMLLHYMMNRRYRLFSRVLLLYLVCKKDVSDKVVPVFN